MLFSTPVLLKKSGFPISYDSEIVSIGSCFAENIAQKFAHFQFRSTANPFGILFHPLAIEKFLEFAVSGKRFDASDIFFHNERWHCFDTHSCLSDSNSETLLEKLTQAVSTTRQKGASATHFVITLGTAWAYRSTASQELVANCHKVPQREFSKELLSIEAISGSVRNIASLISRMQPNAQIIFTISPVCHLKDGFVENQRSKAHLISGVHSAIEMLPNCAYFASYEIMMDELRDYRFYAPDMLHPSAVAIDYIWQKFASCWISEDAFQDMNEIDAIQRSLAHRPFNENSDAHRKFSALLNERIEILRKRLPFLSF